MNLEKPIVLLLIIQAVTGMYYELTEFHIPYWIQNGNVPEIFEVAHFVRRIFRYLSIVLTIVGAIKIIQNQEIKLNKAFKLPMYYLVGSSITWIIASTLSTKFSYINFSDQMNWYTYLLIFLNQVLLLLIVLHFVLKNDNEFIVSYVEVGKWSRFWNWTIDRIIIFSFSFSYLQLLGEGSIIEDIEILNNNPYWYLALNMFLYYFVLEALFKQTIGKLHSGAIVISEDNRTKTAFIRTICRFIPLEAFSFFGKKGLHDSISNSLVGKASENEFVFDEI
ncbi:MAG: RDD family protein [Bacteroidia bacterium]